ncbi:MAG: type II toxin-antitoxin system HicB family antitoxin [Candidatus Gracilibacteria bacterium]|nr:type II toxin-antitoxin system HicB family antitoxin [Candidatus Gracilibacteria bacterium]MDQ7022685.1 type II toxin-antitoxin system HicB family antitoxin [Candidatus Gracilibacteria bacterium]
MGENTQGNKSSCGVKLPIIIKKDDNNTFMAYSPIFKGCHTFAENKEELKQNIEEVTGMYFEMFRDGEKVLEGDNILYLNFDKNGKITSDFSKEFAKNSFKILS